MPRYLTTYVTETDKIECFTEQGDYRTAVDNAADWVWQFAPDPETAIKQHFTKLDQWEIDPTKDTY